MAAWFSNAGSLTIREPVRGTPLELGATTNSSASLPVPLAPLVIVIQPAVLQAIQSQSS